MGNVKFHVDKLQIGEIKPNSKDNIIEFTFSGLMSDITHTHKSCSCVGDVLRLKDRLQIRYDETKAKDIKLGDLAKLPQGKFAFSESVDVYMNDGKDLMIFDEATGRKKYNPDKEKVTLFFMGYVDTKKMFK